MITFSYEITPTKRAGTEKRKAVGGGNNLEEAPEESKREKNRGPLKKPE